MKLSITSDFHLDFYSGREKYILDSLSKDFDVLVVAGDLCSSRTLTKHLNMICKYFKDKEVIYTSGNHEFYHSSFKKVEQKIKRISKKYSNFHYLENERIKIKDKYFCGATLWYPSSFYTDVLKNNCSDFIWIEQPEDIFYRHAETLLFLKKELQQGDILITHHLPSNKCVSDFFEGNSYNCFFVGDIENIILQQKPSVVIYGHTHESNYFDLDGVKFYCNPYGYPREQQKKNMKKFDSNLIVEV